MKLVKLTINEKFRSLSKGFVINFREDDIDESWKDFHPFCFAGLNGSGKSNVLEALANIFYHLECCTLNVEYSEYLKSDFNKTKSDLSAYELEYYIIPKDSKKQIVENYIKVIIHKEDEKAPVLKIISQDQIIESEFIEVDTNIRSFLPEFVIGYSSGENEILSLPFVKSRLLQFDEYLYHLEENATYELEKKPESSLVYMDYHSSQAILLANFLLQEDDTLQPIKDQLEIEKLHSFRLVINNHKLYYPEENKKISHLLPLVRDTIDKLRKCNSISYIEKNKSLEVKDNVEFEYLDFHFNQDTKDAFKKHFENPLKLFKAFQVLSLLNLRILDNKLKKEIYNSESLYAMYKIPAHKEEEHIFHFNLFKIKKEKSNDKMLLKAFSDGEHQFLHTMGICLMLQNRSVLFLLDEPETHFNPEWRSEFISILKNSLDKSGTNHLMREIIITSHSPFIISDCYPDKVIVFKKNEQPQSAFDKNFRTYGTSVDLIMEHIFKRNNTIGDLSNSELIKIEIEIKDLEKLTEEQVKAFKNRVSHLGDSMEKILLFTKLNELKKHTNA